MSLLSSKALVSHTYHHDAQAVLTLVSSIYHLVVEFGAPAGYNYWAILGLDIFFVVMWLIAFAILTAQVAPALSEWGSYYMEDFLATQITAAALGGVQLYVSSCSPTPPLRTPTNPETNLRPSQPPASYT